MKTTVLSCHKKFKVQQSATKVIATVFWDPCGMILLDICQKERVSMLIDIVKHFTDKDMLFDAKNLDSCVAESSFNMTMRPPTQQNAQRNGLNITGGRILPIQPTVHTLHS
ncbi:hypothetical protein ElyMa_006092400 [Elysia marginata]|uniref:Uncharacterized protein n=1 Tax=Elysia marginata TaxID=1093978 RepID=A0AAV4GRC1_9GAST|nr:hypothetical protein ElyMa_006092400 [Elysia marginata]